MTVTDFRDLLAGWLSGDPRFATLPGDYADADDILALPAIDCPTGCFKGGVYKQRNRMLIKFPCPTCTGTGKATVAQLLAWGSAVAQTDLRVEDWSEYDRAHEAIADYRNRILGVQP